MEFLEEEARPRFLFQSSRTSAQQLSPNHLQSINKPLASICILTALLISLLTVFFLQSETLRFLLLWISLSLLIGPFAPTSITGGDIRVGQGDLLLDPPPPDLNQTTQIDEHYKKRRNYNKSRKPQEPITAEIVNEKKYEKVGNNEDVPNGGTELVLEEREWVDADFDLLKKQIIKHPVGTPRRWELIAEAFKGRHGVDSVIKMGKSNSERKQGGGDSFLQFLKQRKPVDKRVEEELNENGEVKKESNGGTGESLIWTSAEDIVLLNALKAFPKEVSMRWEKIAVAVPGKSKASCVKRVAELKKGFRSSKASVE